MYKTHVFPVWTLPVKIFVDDTSANRSKSWLGLHCIQMQPAGKLAVLVF